MGGHRHQQREQHRVARHLEAEVDQRLHPRRREPDHRTDPQPPRPRVVAAFAEPAAHFPDEDAGGQHDRRADEQAPLGRELQIVIVGLDRAQVEAVGLVAEHGDPVGVEPHAGQGKVTHDARGVAPQADAPVGVERRRPRFGDLSPDRAHAGPDGNAGQRHRQAGRRQHAAPSCPLPRRPPRERAQGRGETRHAGNGSGDENRERHHEHGAPGQHDLARFPRPEPDRTPTPVGGHAPAGARRTAGDVAGGHRERHHHPAREVIRVDERRGRRPCLPRIPHAVDGRTAARDLHETGEGHDHAQDDESARNA